MDEQEYSYIGGNTTGSSIHSKETMLFIPLLQFWGGGHYKSHTQNLVKGNIIIYT